MYALRQTRTFRPAAAVSSSQEAWRTPDAVRARLRRRPHAAPKAAFWERVHQSATTAAACPFCSDADVASEPDVDRRRLSADWDSSKSDSGRGSYGRQQSCPSWITNSNESLNFHNSRKLESTASSESREHRANYHQTSTHESRSRTADSRFSSHEKENDSKWFSNHDSRSKTADSQFNAHEKEDAKWIRSQETRSEIGSRENQDKWIPSQETKSEINNSLFNENQDSKWVRSHETRSGVDDSGLNSHVKDDTKWIPSQETKSVIDDSLFKSQEKENTTRWATSHDLRSDTAHNQYGSNGKENNAKRLPNQETSFTHVDSSESKMQKEEEDLKWFSSQEVKYGYVDSEARTHFVEDSKWPPSSLDKRFEFVDSESKILHEKEQSEVNKKWSEMVQSNSTSKSSFHDEKFSSLPKNFERHKFENLFDSSETKKEIDKKVASETSSREDYSSQMCTREEKRQESQQSYHLESSSHRTTSKKCLETEFEKSFEQFAKMMQTGEESLLFKKAEEIVLEDESKMFSENFKETERRFESYVKDLNATDNANVEKKFEKTVKSEEISVTRSHTPAGFYDNHQEASGEMEEKKKVEGDKTSDASRDAPSTPNVEKRRRPASELLDRQGLYDAFNRLRSSSPSDVNETLFRICDVLQTDAPSSTETGRQQSQISGGGNSPSATAYHDSTVPAPPPPPPPMMSQGGAPPPPPPPPPLGLVHIPNMRLKTEIADVRKEPPAAIQNAMMTKDKKPFTYTPGGLDLSEIRSPRMARRINRNAHAEDAAAAADPPRPAAQPRPLSMPPQPMAVPVFPPPPPPPPPAAPQQQWTPPAPQQQWTPPPPAPQQQWTPPPPPQMMAVPKLQPVQQRQAPSPVQQNTGSIYVPPVQPVQSPRSQLGSLYVPPVNNNNNGNRSPIQQQQDSPSPQLNKSPAPWMTRNSPQQQQQAKEVPPWVVVNRDTPSSPDAPPQPPPPAYNNNNYGSAQSQTRIIPIQVRLLGLPI
ncbi:hypothetical protein LSTR_LSTR014468 [Laodelphax striatellus]|uniref:Uncharacterized protein n=1 Tax=Laodelphax striatellus TaxID=195883 RepID=A0A482XI65_LAOST|nr:hypothetical protein LSTR_LSTR014468 [Laodelphax striatellus]